MEDTRKQKLSELGADVLADSLLKLSLYSDDAENLVDRLLATPAENVNRFRKKFSTLKHSTHFVDYGEAPAFARKLQVLLQDLAEAVEDPVQGIDLVTDFFEMDNALFDRCDDSMGCIGDVFRYDAAQLFKTFASHCEDKQQVAQVIVDVNRQNNYGVRDCLIDCAIDYLPETVIREVIDTFQQLALKHADSYERGHYSYLIESLARQIKDPKLFEQTRRASWGELSASACIDIATVYFESGAIDTAHDWLEKIDENDRVGRANREKLLSQIYLAKGDTDKLGELLLQQFRAYPSEHTLHALLDVVGEGRRDSVVSKQIDQIKAKATFLESDAVFLLQMNEIDTAEQYILQRADQLNGDAYISLPKLAKSLESGKRHLVVSLIYRSLLLSILRRGYTKSYPYGVRYLKKLDRLAEIIEDWKTFGNHESFKAQIVAEHRRKRSFWSKYNDLARDC